MLLASWPPPSTTQKPPGSTRTGTLPGTYSSSCSAPSLHFSTPQLGKVLATGNDQRKGDNRSTHVPRPLDPNQSKEKPMNPGMLYMTLTLIKYSHGAPNAYGSITDAAADYIHTKKNRAKRHSPGMLVQSSVYGKMINSW